MNKPGSILILTLVLAGAGNVWAQQKAESANPAPEGHAVAQVTTSYRLNYSVTESDGGKRTGTQHFSLTASSDNKYCYLRLGSRIPIATGTVGPDKDAGTQFQYVDVGLNISANIRELPNGLYVDSKVEQSSIAEEESGIGRSDPIIRQATLQNSAILTAGKPVMLGSLDVPGSTRHLDIEVVLELVR